MPASSPPAAATGTYVPLWLLALVTISGTLAMHMFVPALPDAARHFQADSAAVQGAISAYIAGLALGQLAYGPLSDALGRRPMLLAGLVLYVLGGLAAMLAPSVPLLVGARLLQALGGCAGLALGRAMVRDTHAPADAVRALALLNLMMMVGPGLAPLVGSTLVALGGWRAVFALLTLLGAATLLLVWRRVPETAQASGRLRPGRLARDYGVLLRSPRFVAYAVGGGCATTSVYAFIAAAPFIITGQLGRPLGDVGVSLAVIMLGLAAGSLLASRLAQRVGVGRLLLWGNGISVASGALFLLLELTGWLTLVAAVGLMVCFVIGAGLASPAVLAKVLALDARRVGSAVGLYGFVQMALGAVFSALVGWGGNPAMAAAVVLFGAALLGQGCLQFALLRSRAPGVRR